MVSITANLCLIKFKTDREKQESKVSLPTYLVEFQPNMSHMFSLMRQFFLCVLLLVTGILRYTDSAKVSHLTKFLFCI